MGNAGSSFVLLLALMAALAAVESWIPLRERRIAQRWRPNLLLAAAFFAVNLALTAGVLVAAAVMGQRGSGLLNELPLAPAWTFAIGVLALDFLAYVAHVLLHKLPWLWRIHRVHHSDLDVDVTTAFRQHPLETVLRFLFTFVPAVALGVSPAATAAYRLLSGINAIFEHANIRVAARLDRALRWVVVTPHMHKVHHSRLAAETDSNYGNIFSIFDRAFGTYTPTDRVPRVRYGLDPLPRPQSFTELLKLPWA